MDKLIKRNQRLVSIDLINNSEGEMQTYRAETIILTDRTLVVKELPFLAGDKVEVIVRCREREQDRHKRYPLRGKPIRYIAPFGSVAENDWEALQ